MKFQLPWRHETPVVEHTGDAEADKQLDQLFATTFTLLDDLQGTTVKVRKQLELTKEVSRQYAEFRKEGDTEL